MMSAYRKRLLVTVMAPLCGLATPAFAQATSSEAAAQDPETDNRISDGDDIVVTGSRVGTSIRDIAGSVSVISEGALATQLSAASSVDKILERLVPGIFPSSEGVFSGSSNGTGPSLRGRPASVLINGVPMNTLLRANGVDTQLIDTNAVGRVEAKRGATAAYGFGASGGIIQFLTRRGETSDLQITTRAGLRFSEENLSNSLGSEVYVGAGQARDDGLDFYAGFGLTRRGNAFGPDGELIGSPRYRTYNFDLNLGYRLSDSSSLRFTGNYYRRNSSREYDGAGAFAYFDEDVGDYVLPAGLRPDQNYADPTLESRETFQQAYVATAEYINTDIFGSKLSVVGFLQQNTFRNPLIDSTFDTLANQDFAVFEQKIDNSRLGIRSNLTTDVSLLSKDDLQLTYGVDWLRDRMTRTYESGFGSPDQVSVDIPGYGVRSYGRGIVQFPLSPPVQLEGYALFAQFSFKTGPLRLTGGVRYEDSTASSLGYDDGGFVVPSGKVTDFSTTLFNAGAIYDISDTVQIYAGINQGVEVTELGRAVRSLALAQIDAGNAVTIESLRAINLQPAKTTEYEIGVRGSLGGARFGLAGFYSDAKLSARSAAPPGSPPGTVFQPVREPTKIWGVELTAEYRISPAFNVGTLFGYQDGKVTLEGDTAFTQITYDRIAPPRLVAYMDWTPTNRFGLTLQGTKTFSVSPFAPSAYIPFGGAGDGNIEGFITFDLIARLKAGPGEFSLGVENILNEKYLDVATQAIRDSFFLTPAPGRRFALRFKADF